MKAFPTIIKIDADYRGDGYFVESDEGMDLRDYFAGLAMQGIVASFNVKSTVSVITKMSKNENKSVNKIVAEMAYEYADEMMEARK